MIEYYAGHGVVTDPEGYSPLLSSLPTDVADLRDVVQGLLLHLHWAKRYGLDTGGREGEAGLRKITRQLRRIFELDDAPLVERRELQFRLLGTCRDHAALLCAFLRSKEIPARSRCGF